MRPSKSVFGIFKRNSPSVFVTVLMLEFFITISVKTKGALVSLSITFACNSVKSKSSSCANIEVELNINRVRTINKL